MNERERKLAIAVGAMVLLWGANLGWGKYQAVLQQNSNQQQRVAQELSTAKTASLRGKRAQNNLRVWNAQSLPTAPDFAKSLYQDWLREKLTSAGLSVKGLDVTSSRSRSKSYQEYSFVVSATGQLKQLTDFLYHFYQSPHLHRISQATLTPGEDENSLTISLTVDALSLVRAEREDQLATEDAEVFSQPLEEFEDTITGRNLFAKYQSRRTDVARVREVPEDNEASQAIFSGIHYGESGWLMLVRMQQTGKLLYFREGDEIRIGRFRGVIEQLDGDLRRATVSVNSGRVELLFGKTLAEALPARGPAS